MVAARRIVLAIGLAAAALAAAAAPAMAQPSTVPPSAMPPPPPPPGPPIAGIAPARRVHRGLYLHADLGVALPTFTTSDTFDGSEVTLTGGGLALGIALGHSLRDNFIVHVALFDHLVANPTVRQYDVEQTLEGSALDLVGVGVGATYYFMPTNLSISATVVGARLRAREEVNGNLEESFASDSGGGLSLAVGKEWYVGRSTGLGVAAQLFVGSLTDDGTDPTAVDDTVWSAASFGLLFSATYH